MMRVPFYRASIGDEELNAVVKVLKSGWLTTGEVCREYEKEFAKYVGVEYAIAVNSCTSALFLTLRYMRNQFHGGPQTHGLPPKVAVPTWTFVATANAVQQAGFVPVFIDCEPDSLNMDMNGLENAVLAYGDIVGVVPVHFAGELVDWAGLRDVIRGYALRKNKALWVVEDAAHALGTMNVHGGFASCYSTYATKNITTGEGGVIATDDEDFYEWVIKARNHGLGRTAIDRYTSGVWQKPECEMEGYKANLPDVLAAIGLAQLRKIDAFVGARRLIAGLYDELIAAMNNRLGFEIARPLVRSSSTAPHLYVVILDSEIQRDVIAKEMTKRGVEVQLHYVPLHLHPYWRMGRRTSTFPCAEEMNHRALTLPFFVEMTDTEQWRVIDVLETVIQENR